MKKTAKELSKGEIIKLYFGAAPFPTYHEIISIYMENGVVYAVVSMPYGSEKVKFGEDEMVEVKKS